jgi:FkbM family methyltransferase
MIKGLVKNILATAGFKLIKIKKAAKNGSTTLAPNIFSDTMQAGLYRNKNRGIIPKTIIDVGAAEGTWTLAAMNVWKDSQYVLMEPLQERKAKLTALKNTYNNVYIVNAAAGDKKGTIPFFVAEDLDGSGIADNGTLARTIPVTTIDEEVKKWQLPGPYIIKLDTHGYEVPILGGATETIKHTLLVIIECYGFQIAPQSLLFWEMCRYMQEKGFRLIDVVDVMRREKDHAFWQCDAFFVPATSPVFSSNTYR